MQPYELGIKAAQDAIAKGELCALEIVDSVIGRYHEKNGELHAYLTFDEEGARAAARANPKAVPVAIKDLINVRGQPCTCGSRILEGYVSTYNATLIDKMAANGFIPAGRTNMDELAMGSSTENSAFGPSRNPFDTERVPGGSSGGSSAAVGGDMCIAALGSDTGGSIRQPASFCNCVGLKPTYGRVSRYGVTAFASSLDQVGPLTKDVTDAAILFEAMAGYDPKDATTLREGAPQCVKALEGASLKGVRIGLPKECYGVKGTDPEVERITREAIDKCADAGAEIVEVSLPHSEYAMSIYYIVGPAEASANFARFDGVRYGFRSPEAKDVATLYTKSRTAGFGAEVKRRIIIGTFVLSSGLSREYFAQAQKVRSLVRRDFEKAFENVDALLTPCAPTPAFKFGARQDPISMYLNDLFTIPSSLAGICAVGVPAGFTKPEHLPVGIQFICDRFEEPRLLRIAKAFEDVR